MNSWPQYNAPHSDQLHALGMISLNYNSYEHSLFSVFRHHLEVHKVPNTFSEFLFGELNGKQQVEAIKQVFQTYEKEPLVRDRIDHLLLHFAWCFETRNILLHAHHREEIIWDRPFDDAPNQEGISLAKRASASYSKLNFMYLSLPHLRAIADHMHEGYSFCMNLWAHLRFRDDLVPPEVKQMVKEMPFLWQTKLPSKPPIPRKVKLQDHPVNPASGNA